MQVLSSEYQSINSLIGGDSHRLKGATSHIITVIWFDYKSLGYPSGEGGLYFNFLSFLFSGPDCGALEKCFKRWGGGGGQGGKTGKIKTNKKWGEN